MGEQREVLSLHHKHSCVGVCAHHHPCLSDISRTTWRINSKLGLWIGHGISQKPIVLGCPQINIKLILAKTKETFSERYLKNDLAYQLQTWSWDPLDA